MKSIIKESFERSMSYEAYRTLVKQLVDDHSSTGINKSEEFIHFTKLNERRMKRWDKTITLSQEAQQRILGFQKKVTWLVITESWCGDAAHVLPALYKVASFSDNIDFKVVIRDENPQLMEQFLTKGSASIPKVIIIDDETGDVLKTYGPRPTEAANYVKRFVAKNGKLTPAFKADLQHWYNDNKGQNVIEDITMLLAKLQVTACQQT
ncbi:thioredoxin family protein [Tamlana sp. 2_MG-2023]|uniref:thioredoxin family protein n=1 Tax=unclassified Tamlana TaxID=2614803 RepID=UPI0026E32F64|nr:MULTISPECIES: thioredoxin family protein [unclassified Tamlana]MDO6760607.1 thioredoxin family protein [Tamlana sp. 2_MG-2023]MDO6790863.1 thioredoxin family protein [Tamlana sp. 1_MG-2023]